MGFVLAFLAWSTVIAFLFSIVLMIRAWRVEVLRGDDPRWRSRGFFPWFARNVRRLGGRGSDIDADAD